MIQQFHSKVFTEKKYKHTPQSNICIRIFIATLFIIAKHQKELRCPSIRKWINKLQCIHKMKCSSLIRNELVIPTTMWVNFKTIMLNKRSQTQKIILYGFTYVKFKERQYQSVGLDVKIMAAFVEVGH